ncbi:MAG: hypothetical protein WC284_18660 [Candidimonas sp.]
MTKITIGDTIYDVDRFYREGAMAHRQRRSWSSNPYRHGSHRYDQFSRGYENEESGEHFRDGQDILTIRRGKVVPNLMGQTKPAIRVA